MTTFLKHPLILILFTISCHTEVPAKEVFEKKPKDTTVLFTELKTMDSLLFNIGFNECNLAVFDSLVGDDFEFYHDQSGITPTKQDFLNGTENGLCTMDYKAIRKLEPGSLSAFPMYNNGELYGALQTGFHRFYALYPNSPELELTSEARFSHLWLKEDNQWKLARVISYDHIVPSE